MAERTISTVLAIEGEDQYRASVKNINAELKLLKSQMELVTATYATDAERMEAYAARGEVLQAQYAKQAEKVKLLQSAMENAGSAYETYQRKAEACQGEIEQVTAKMQALDTSTEGAGEEQRRLANQLEQLKARLADLTARQDAAKSGVTKWATETTRAQTELQKLDNAIQGNNAAMQSIRDAAGQAGDGFGALGDEAQQSGEKVKQSGNDTKQGVDTMAVALAAAGLKAAFREISQAITECLESYQEFESAMAGVYKTVDGSEEQLAALEQGIKDLSTEIPATTTEIAAVAEAAGQLGIATDDILAFTQVITAMGVSTNLSTEEAASQLAKFANIAGTSADDYSRLGSAIVDLGNNFATTEQDIVNMSMRVASTGTVIGLSEAEILAVATALSSVGIEAEAGGSAISKLLKYMDGAVANYAKATQVIDSTGYSMRELQLMSANSSKDFKALAQSIGLTDDELSGYVENLDDLGDYAKIAGQSASEFAQAWANDPVRALDSFITGLNGVQTSGGNATAVLQEMDLTEIRLSNAILALASNGGILTQALDTSNAAWAENAALATEAGKRYETTESQLQILDNRLNLVKVSLGEQLNPALLSLKTAGAGALEWLDGFIQKNDWLVPSLAAVIASAGVFTTALVGFNVITKVLPLITAFNAVLAANPIGAVVVAVTALTAGLATLVLAVGDAKREWETLVDASAAGRDAFRQTTEAIDTQQASAQELVTRLYTLMDAEEKTAGQKAQIADVVDRLNEAIPELALSYNQETDAINLTREAIDQLVQAEFDRQKNEAALSRMNELYAAQQALAEQRTQAMEDLAAAEEKAAGAGNGAGGFLANSGMERYVAAARAQLDGLNKAIQTNADEYDALSLEVEAYAASQTAAASASGTAAQAVAASAQTIRDQTAAWQEAGDQTRSLSEAAASAGKSLENVTQAAVAEVEATREQGDTYDTARRALDALGTAYDQRKARLQAQTEQLQAAIDRENAAYDEAVEAARDSLEGQAALWDDLAEDTDISVQDICASMEDVIAQLQAQTEAARNQLSNMATAMELGYNEAFVESLREPTQQNQAMLEAMVEGTQGDVDAINAAWGDYEAALDSAAQAQATLETDHAKVMDGLVKKQGEAVAQLDMADEAFAAGAATVGGLAKGILSEQQSAEDAGAAAGLSVQAALAEKLSQKEMSQIGKDAMAGLASGVTAKKTSVDSAFADAADSGVATTRQRLKIKSPSLVFAEIGRQTVQGLVQGVQKNLGDVETAYAALADATLKGTLEQLGSLAAIAAYEDTTATVVELYRQMQEAVHVAAEGYRAAGYADTTIEILRLKEQWWGYEKDLEKLYDQQTQEASAAAQAQADAAVAQYQRQRKSLEYQLDVSELSQEQYYAKLQAALERMAAETGYTIEQLLQGAADVPEDLTDLVRGAYTDIYKYNEQLNESLEQTDRELEKLYDDHRAKALSAAEGAFGLADAATGELEVTLEDLKQAQASQADFWRDYTRNLEAAQQMGMDGDLLASLADGTQESAAYLELLLSGGYGQVQQFSRLYDEVAQAEAEFAKTTAGIQMGLETELAQAAQELQGSIGGDYQALGEEMIRSVIAGISGQTDAVAAAVKNALAVSADVAGSFAGGGALTQSIQATVDTTDIRTAVREGFAQALSGQQTTTQISVPVILGTKQIAQVSKIITRQQQVGKILTGG